MGTISINILMNFNKLIKILLEDYDAFDISETVEFTDMAVQNIFATLWGDWIENNSQKSAKYRGILSGNDIMEIAPHYTKFLKPKEQRSLENKIYSAIAIFEEANRNIDILKLYEYAMKADGQDPENPDDRSTKEMFGYYVLMKMLGHGVSWEDDHEKPGFAYPHIEISYLEFPQSFHEIEDDEESEDDEIEEWEKEGEEWREDDFDADSGEEWKR
jgi:hypothetical protein